MGKKRSRSRSRDSKRRKEEKLDKIQMQIDNLTKVVEALTKVQQEREPLISSKIAQVLTIETAGKPE